jgi:acyl-CoA oxidase
MKYGPSANAHSLFLFRFEGDNYILDFQVVRASLKAFRAYSSAHAPSPSALSPFTTFLRHIHLPPAEQTGVQVDNLNWRDPHTAVHLLELRALCVIRDYANNEGEPDAHVAQRVAKAITEAFVAAQVEQFIRDIPADSLLSASGSEASAHVVADLLSLVSIFHFPRTSYHHKNL